MLLREATLPEPGAAFPFTLPPLRSRAPMAFDAPVTVLVGENGSGKSTLLEALAYACELPAAGTTQQLDADPTLAHVRPLGDGMRLSWERKTRRGFFLRSEDFFGFVRQQNAMKREMRAELARLRRDSAHLPDAELARISAPYAASVAATESRYGGDLDGRSHGESFLAFFKGRLTGEGLYVIDEPEAALSPLRQLAFLALVKDTVGRGGQFVIATHAPIVMAYPGARIYELRPDGFAAATFDELEHVQTLRAFLAAPEAYLRHL